MIDPFGRREKIKNENRRRTSTTTTTHVHLRRRRKKRVENCRFLVAHKNNDRDIKIRSPVYICIHYCTFKCNLVRVVYKVKWGKTEKVFRYCIFFPLIMQKFLEANVVKKLKASRNELYFDIVRNYAQV